MDVDSYVFLDKRRQVPIGANRSLYLPISWAAHPHLDASARAFSSAFPPSIPGGICARTVMEGVSYSLKDCLSVLEEMGVAVGNMAACRAAGQRPLAADAPRICTIARQDHRLQEGPALGVALLAAVGAGEYSSVTEACSAVIQYGPACEPVAENTAAYLKYYKLYKELYQA